MTELEFELKVLHDLIFQMHAAHQVQFNALAAALERQGTLRRKDYERELRLLIDRGPSHGETADLILQSILDGEAAGPSKRLTREEVRDALSVVRPESPSPEKS